MPFLKNPKCQTLSVSKHCEKISKLNGLRPIFVYPGDGIYRGYWRNDNRHGSGTKIQSNKLTYDGQWQNNLRHGEGIVRKTLPNGVMERIYIGGWKYDMKFGEGKKYYKNGTYYGQWENDVRSGYGIMWYTSGAIYFGEWLNDKYDGVGVLYQKNGNRYEGWFSNGKKHGEGIFYHRAHGQIQKGIWQYHICKTSIVFDHFRNQVTQPTPYSIQACKLSEPDILVHDLFRQYLPDIEEKSDSLLGLPCFELVKKIKKRFQDLKV